MENMIDIRNLQKGYTGEGETITVLDDLCLEIPQASIASVEGASGEGKSTLLNIIGTIDSASGGFISVADHDLMTMSDRQKERFRSEILGFIFQHHYLLPDFTVLENVMMPLLIQKMNFLSARREAAEMLKMVGLGHRFDHYPSMVSGGEMARSGVARALVGGKALILADEPTGNLDHQTSDRLADLLWQLQEELQFTLLIVTHDMRLAGRVPFRYSLDGGKIFKKSGDV